MQWHVLGHRIKQLGIIFAVCTGLALIPGIQAHNYIASLGHPVTWQQTLMPAFINHWIWATLAPGVLWLASRYPIERGHWARLAGIHVLGSIAFATLHVALRCPFLQTTIFTAQPMVITWTLFRNSLGATFYPDLWIYATIVAVSQGWNLYRKYKDRELRASKLEAQLAQAQIQVLKMQLNPHFLFNTLHAISSLMHEDVEAADNMLTGLSDLLRMGLEHVNDQEIPLQREVEFLQGYLGIQQIRFRDRLAVRMDVPASTLDALVPNMILQPLVENAVTHGIASRSAGGEIVIRAQREYGALRLEVTDNGNGAPSPRAERPPGGLGLTNTRARLQQLYGEAHRFRIEKGAGGGTIVTLEIPFRAAPGPKHE